MLILILLSDLSKMARRELKDRVFISSSKMPSLPQLSSKPFNVRPSQYKLWDTSAMSEALSAVVTGGMSVREAATHFGVPKSTLGDRVSGRVLSGAVSGPPTYQMKRRSWYSFCSGVPRLATLNPGNRC